MESIDFEMGCFLLIVTDFGDTRNNAAFLLFERANTQVRPYIASVGANLCVRPSRGEPMCSP